MNRAFLEYYRCPERFANFTPSGQLRDARGYFRLGPDLVCFGRSTRKCSEHWDDDGMPDLWNSILADGSVCALPLDPTDVADSMRLERYAQPHNQNGSAGFHPLARKAYYQLRPFLPVSVRKHLQCRVLQRRSYSFPQWPVDHSVDSLCASLLLFIVETTPAKQVPFIWFWPDGHSSCTIMTHDVETKAGLDFCRQLMAIDDSFGVKASFQLIPEERYSIPDRLVQEMRDRGCEINIHDLNHDGRLFSDHETFRRRAPRINEYGHRYGANGFRSGALYRNAEWYEHLDFAYDMSVPNTGHMDPQWGGCCTVMPFFIAGMVELPVTATQDYSLFHILNDYSLTLWQEQLRLITERNGLASFIVHPDYVQKDQAQTTYEGLLEHLSHLRYSRKMWFALPGEVAKWWCQRSRMELVRAGDSWRVTGPGSERATVAYAYIRDQHLSYRLELN